MEISNANWKIEKKRVVVGMSGGIDSSIALLLLQKQGWDCVAVHLDLSKWLEEKSPAQAQIKKLCQKLKIPFYILDVKKEFEKKIVSYFIHEYKNGRTPNPCIICNPQLKFEVLLKFAKKNKINYVATGHYARVREIKNQKSPASSRLSRGRAKIKNYELQKAKDKTKDQTYYLSFLTQNQLKHFISPLGGYTKKQVIQMAKNIICEGDGRTSKKLYLEKESQDFCYCPSKLVAQFLKEKLGLKPGKIVEYQGKNKKPKILGQHQGIHFYTIGQRKRINLSGGPYFVLKLDAQKNQVIATKNEKDLYQKEVLLWPFNFISGHLPKKPIKVKAKIRYGHQAQTATLSPVKNNQLKLIFAKPQRAVTAGQFAVFYSGQVCLGGGKINS